MPSQAKQYAWSTVGADWSFREGTLKTPRHLDSFNCTTKGSLARRLSIRKAPHVHYNVARLDHVMSIRASRIGQLPQESLFHHFPCLHALSIPYKNPYKAPPRSVNKFLNFLVCRFPARAAHVYWFRRESQHREREAERFHTYL